MKKLKLEDIKPGIKVRVYDARGDSQDLVILSPPQPYEGDSPPLQTSLQVQVRDAGGRVFKKLLWDMGVVPDSQSGAWNRTNYTILVEPKAST